MAITYSKGKPGKVANPARVQMNRKTLFFLSPFGPENYLVSRGGFGNPVPRQPAHLHTQAEPVCRVTNHSCLDLIFGSLVVPTFIDECIGTGGPRVVEDCWPPLFLFSVEFWGQNIGHMVP